MDKEVIWGIFVSDDARRFPNFFPIAFLATKCPNVKSLNMKVIKPSDVATIIVEAMKQGWTPKDKGKPLCFSLSGSTLVPR
ncbi:hypothetical protein GC096_31920 [Paenibacillus sp. LMG 31461]|uniref:Uncharacterized protein n=1 Tax=Paenibacillus plantarum TaxID=2654975 RepID=A0ABX1XLC2_9BACL|nr:hypothetical protein [Paenibacillus plantarum]NOU68644.1 hypothetical protein [Paenibacillus plantarum]